MGTLSPSIIIPAHGRDEDDASMDKPPTTAAAAAAAIITIPGRSPLKSSWSRSCPALSLPRATSRPLSLPRASSHPGRHSYLVSGRCPGEPFGVREVSGRAIWRPGGVRESHFGVREVSGRAILDPFYIHEILGHPRSQMVYTL